MRAFAHIVQVALLLLAVYVFCLAARELLRGKVELTAEERTRLLNAPFLQSTQWFWRQKPSRFIILGMLVILCDGILTAIINRCVQVQ